MYTSHIPVFQGSPCKTSLGANKYAKVLLGEEKRCTSYREPTQPF